MTYKPFLYIANWKLNKTLDQGIHYFHLNQDALHAFAVDQSIEVIIAPTYVSLAPLWAFASKISVHLAAQDCSEHEAGPYNGQVDTVSLSQVGVRYGIIGHSQPTDGSRDTNLAVANKLERLLAVGIRPIICVGETADEHKKGIGKQIVAQQLKLIFGVLEEQVEPTVICIAYEPVWAVGGGASVSKEHIAAMIAWIKELTALLPQHTFYLVYGGGVDENNAAALRTIEGLNGFLIGKASLDFKNFEKIVSLTKK